MLRRPSFETKMQIAALLFFLVVQVLLGSYALTQLETSGCACGG